MLSADSRGSVETVDTSEYVSPTSLPATARIE